MKFDRVSQLSVHLIHALYTENQPYPRLQSLLCLIGITPAREQVGWNIGGLIQYKCKEAEQM